MTGGVLILAGASKLAQGPASFKRVVQAYELLPERWSRLVAVGLPPLEISVGTIVVLGAFARLGAALALLILSVVTVAAGSVVMRGLKATCGCFGELTTAVSGQVIARNCVLMGLMAPALLMGGGPISLDAVPSVRLYAASAVAGAVAVAALLLDQERVRQRLVSTVPVRHDVVGPATGSIREGSLP
jgi:uncharacterized membrane protein YphA (DoxX/SURF4 family)